MGFFSKLFGTKKRDETYTGPQPLQSMTGLPLGKTLTDILMRRMQGQGVGYSPDFLYRTTSPVIQQRMARYQEQELPELTAAMSARGLQRSTITADLLRRQAAERESDISSILAQTYAENEREKQRQISEALGMTPGVVGQELGQQREYQQAQYRNYLNQIAAAQEREENRRRMYGGLFQTGANIASYLLPRIGRRDNYLYY